MRGILPAATATADRSSRLARLALLGALLLGTVPGCGLKGDLVLPEDGSVPAHAQDDPDVGDDTTDEEDRS